MASSAAHVPLINITGDSVALGPFPSDLMDTDLRWINDFETQRNLTHTPRPRIVEQTISYHEHVAASSTDVLFAIYEKSTWTPVGSTGLKNIEHHNRSAEFGIMIGERSARGKGYGTETARLMLDYAFTALGLHNVKLEVLEFNIAGINAYQRAGFREIGRRTKCHFARGRFWDLVHMECLATDFTSPVLARVFTPDTLRHSEHD